MLTVLQAIILGALQGITELFPISSLGHSVIVPALLHWNVNEQDPYFLVFLVATHGATAIVLFLFFWRDWVRIIKGILRSLYAQRIIAGDTDARLGWLLIIGTIPAGILGLLFEKKIQAIFISPRSAAIFLTCNGILLVGAELLRRRTRNPSVALEGDARIASLSWSQSFFVGVLQALALIPGFSRTGAALSGGLLVNLSHEDALRFAFLLAVPIIGAAAVLKLPALLHVADHSIIFAMLAGSAAAAICAYLSVRFLSRYFHTEKHSLIPFAIYCIIAGAASLFFIAS